MAEFTTDWFSHNIPVWEKYVKPIVSSNQSFHVLEVGSYEGRSACWMAENLMHHAESEIICVDHWVNREIEMRFNSNTYLHPEINPWKGDWRSVIQNLLHDHFDFDLIYLDADHQAQSVLEQAILCMRLLKPGGMMIFDDYGIQPKPGELALSVGINAFLQCFEHEVDVVHRGWQVIVRKLIHGGLTRGNR